MLLAVAGVLDHDLAAAVVADVVRAVVLLLVHRSELFWSTGHLLATDFARRVPAFRPLCEGASNVEDEADSGSRFAAWCRHCNVRRSTRASFVDTCSPRNRAPVQSLDSRTPRAYGRPHNRTRRRSGRVPASASPQGAGKAETPAAAQAANGPVSSGGERARTRYPTSRRRRGTDSEAEAIERATLRGRTEPGTRTTPGTTVAP